MPRNKINNISPIDAGLDDLSSPGGGRGCCGNIEAGIPPGNTGNTEGTGGVAAAARHCAPAAA